jgi:hypothetical protein
MNKRLVIDLYADYQRLNWQPGWHHDRQMLKGYIAYSIPTTEEAFPALTLGVEAFINTLNGDTKATLNGGASADTIATKANGVSMYVHGNIVKNKLRFFARVDLYNPNKNVDNSKYQAYAGVSSPSGYMTPGYKLTYNPSTGAPTAATSTGDPTSKETFFTVGLDFTPYRGIHFMPNVWYNHYKSQLTNPPGVPAGTSDANFDLVYRMTFFFVFGR